MNTTDNKAVTDSRTVASEQIKVDPLAYLNWLPISDNRAWSLCEKEGKSAPYAGYIVKLEKAYVRCVRTATKTIFDVAHI